MGISLSGSKCANGALGELRYSFTEMEGDGVSFLIATTPQPFRALDRRRYWEHMEASGIRFREFTGKGCLFRGPLSQLMRLQLLASWFASNTQNDVEVAVACFKKNSDLMRSPPYLKYLDPYLLSAWQSLLAEPNRFRVVFVEDLMAHCNSLPDAAQSAWRTYLAERYGV